MQLFRIRWERIMTLVLLAESIYTWIIYFNYETEVKMLALATITTFALILMLISYETIKEFRKEVIAQWQ